MNQHDEREASYRLTDATVGRTVRLTRPVLAYGEVVGEEGSEWTVTARYNAGFRGIEVSLVNADGYRLHGVSGGAVSPV